MNELYKSASCVGKERHESFHAAARVVKRQNSRREKEYMGRPYRCSCCGGWHLGVQIELSNRRRQQERKAERYGAFRLVME